MTHPAAVPGPPESVKQAADAHMMAANELVRAVAAAYPAGTLIMATIGQHRIKARIDSTAFCWWHRPSHITIQNLKTQRFRRIDAADSAHMIEILQPDPPASPDPQTSLPL